MNDVKNMHKNSMLNMTYFRDKYMDKNKRLAIADIGSFDVNGSFRDLMTNPLWTYNGIDIREGKNVDIVLEDGDKWSELKDESYDIIISGNTFEHIKHPWIVIKEIRRILRCGGFVCIIAPNICPLHRVTLDCWRYLPDGMQVLADIAGLDVIEIIADDKKPDCIVADTILIAKKSKRDFPYYLKHNEQDVGIAQLESEINNFGKIISKIKAKTILEIGTFRGGTLLFLSKIADRNATIISIDLPEKQNDDSLKLLESFGKEKNQDIHIILQDCHFPNTLQQVKNILKSRKLDVLFIDENHSYCSTKQSFVTYKHLVRKGGIIGLHDIVPIPTSPIHQVHILWNEIKQKYKYEEIIENKNQYGFGIGVVYL